jgi:multidrug efflux system outer membrane protein
MIESPGSTVLIVRVIIGLTLLVGLNGCLVGPDYERPELEVPTAWKALESVDPEKGPRMVTEILPEAEWWEAFENEELSRFIELALRKNHDVREAAFRVLEGRANIVSSGASLYPQFNLDGSWTEVGLSRTLFPGETDDGSPRFPLSGASFGVGRAVIDLSWELDLWGRIRRGVEAASADMDALEMDRRAVALSLISQVGQTYFRVREFDEQIEIAKKNLAIRQDSLDIITSRAKAGLVSDLDVRRAEVLVAETSAGIPELERLRAVEIHRLEFLTGAPPDSIPFFPIPLREVVRQPAIPVGLPSDLLARRPDILQVEQTLIASNARIGEARAHFFPTISITGSGGFTTTEFAQWFDWRSRSFNFGPSVTLPIFLGGSNEARLEAAEAKYHQMLEKYQQTILNAFREVADLLVALQTRTRQLESQRKQVNSAEAARELAEIRYREGLVTYLDVLEAQRTVLSAELSLVQTERARLTEMVALFKAVGGGWDPHS